LNVYFDVQQLYYVPQYSPVQQRLEILGVECIYVFYRDVSLVQQQEAVAISLGARVIWVADQCEARELYLKDSPSWVVIGNYFEGLEAVHVNSKTALLSHGIGPKSCYYTVSDSMPSVRFVEGPYRAKRLEGLYPYSKFVDTGYAKLDPVVNGTLGGCNLGDLGLDSTKITLLYAPTYYPSSIECFSKDFPHNFKEYNIIVKPHFFSLTNPKYKKQKMLLESWSKAENVYLAGVDEVNILPFMAISDLLISDASSTLFEYAALDKPIVWCDFYKLRWGYRGLFKYRFDNRMDADLYKYSDIALHAKSYGDLKGCVDSQIESPQEFSEKRMKHSLQLAGVVDGKVGLRIAQFMVENE